MKLTKTLFATTLALSATTAFAAEKHQPAPVPVEEKVVVSSQEQSATESQETSDATAAVASEAASAPVASN